MKITKRQLKKIIREAMEDPIIARFREAAKDYNPVADAERYDSNMLNQIEQMTTDIILLDYIDVLRQEIDSPTGPYDEPDRGGGSRNRRY